MDVVAVLSTPAGADALALAGQLLRTGAPGTNRLAVAQRLRSAGFDADISAAALTQAALRKRARDKFGADADLMFFTPTGLAQASRAVVAGRRANRLRGHGIGRCAELGCGIGADTIALARAGIRVRAVDADPLTARIAAANIAALGLAERVRVECAQAAAVDLSGVDAVYSDPSRRVDGPTGPRRVFDPRRYSPPWDFLLELAQRAPATVLKLAPGIDHGLIPAGVEAEWVSVAGDLVEACLWFGPLATVPRRASVLRGDQAAELTGTGTEQAPLAAPRRYVYDPDPAVTRAHLVAEFAATVDGALVDPRIAFTFANRPVATPFGRLFEVIDTPPFARKRLRAALRSAGIGALEIRTRGIGVDPESLRRDLRTTGSRSATLLLTRFGDTPTALLCRPLPGTPPSAGTV
jgi:SAM-dependent methyltransferase